MTTLTIQDLHGRLREQFGEFIPEEELDTSGTLVPAEHHLAVAEYLKSELGFTLYVSVVASHWPAPPQDEESEEVIEESFEVATVLRQPTPGGLLFWWRVKLGANEEIASLYELFAGADWQEREQFDLVGVRFANHPDLRRLMMPEDWEGHPLRKEYAIDTPHSPWR